MLETGKGLEVKVKLNLGFPRGSEHSPARHDFGDGRGAPGHLMLETVTSKYIHLTYPSELSGGNTTGSTDRRDKAPVFSLQNQH